jgi:hypothetical protein
LKSGFTRIVLAHACELHWGLFRVTTLWGGCGVDVHLFEESGLECLEIVILQSSIPIAFKKRFIM